MGASKISTSLIFLSCLLLASSAVTTAFNISAVLEDIPSFSTFNDLLSEAGLVKTINTQSPVTILAISNDQIGDLAGKPIDVKRIILQTHVVLDYYDLMKLQNAKNATKMTTLFQRTGTASYDQGFLILTKSNGQITLSSASKGASHDVHVVGTVTQRPFNYSIISVSHAIVPPGIEGTSFAPPPAKAAGAPAPAKKVSPPPASEAPEASAPADDATAPSPDAPSEAPADAPAADAPASDAPAAEAPAADAADSKNASFKHLASSTLGFLALLASFLAAC